MHAASNGVMILSGLKMHSVGLSHKAGVFWQMKSGRSYLRGGVYC